MKTTKVLSWGCGVQSTCLAVMSVLGELPPLDYIITADTQNESQVTYKSREFYINWLEKKGRTVHIVSIGSIVDLNTKEVDIPFWTSGGGPLRRQCTGKFKIKPIRRRLRVMMGFLPSTPPHPKPGSVEQWLGISWDEVDRMRTSGVKYIRNHYPLVERRLTRSHCVDMFKKWNLPLPPPSLCVICPYRPASSWLKMKNEHQLEWAQAVKFDEDNRHHPNVIRSGDTKDKIYLYKKAVPLRDANLSGDAKKEKKGKQLKMFCDGYCDV